MVTKNSLYSVKHSLFCKYKFDSCGKYQMLHGQCAFDSKRACGCPTDTGLCPITHTHVKSNGDTHTYLEYVESPWGEDDFLNPPYTDIGEK